MDAVHKPEELPFVSHRIQLTDFHLEADVAFTCLNLALSDLEFLDWDDPDNINDDKFSAWHLVAPDYEKLDDKKENLGASMDGQLQTTAFRLRDLQRRKEKLSFRQTANQIARYRRIDFSLMHPNANAVFSKPNDIVLNVIVMIPYNRPLERRQIRLGRLMIMDSMFLVLGRNSLADLHHKIKCVSNHAVHTDLSNVPLESQDTLPEARDVHKGAFFFIEDVLYEQTGVGDSDDATTALTQWCSRRLKGTFPRENMSNVKWSDLSLRLGRPYLYRHQLICEHLVVVTDISLLQSHFPDDVNSYPVCVSKTIHSRTLCLACKNTRAKFVTVDNERTNVEPAFWCRRCYQAFNFNQKDTKIGEFKAFKFTDRSTI